MIENGEILNLDNKEYILISKINFENKTYGLLMSNFKPIEIMYVKFIKINDKFVFEVINDKQTKEKLTILFSEEK